MAADFNKNDLKLIAKLYISAILIEVDCGYDPEDVELTEEQASYITKYINDYGRKIRGENIVSSGSLKSIVKYVEDKYFE